jgi:hypothetical protein
MRRTAWNGLIDGEHLESGEQPSALDHLFGIVPFEELSDRHDAHLERDRSVTLQKRGSRSRLAADELTLKVDEKRRV